jgi:hypothetical protein
MWYRRYRMLLVAYGLASLVGVREYLVARSREPLTWLSPTGAELTDLLARINPDDPDTHFLRSMQVLAAGDDEGFSRLLENALAADIKHNELLLKAKVDYLLSQGADWRELNAALRRWRTNYPFSTMSISLPLDDPPRTSRHGELLRQALMRVPWVADARINPPREGSGRPWQAEILFRRGRAIDIREATQAIASAAGG